MNLGITKKIQRSGVVMNPTIHPARKRNMSFAMTLFIPFQHDHITIMQIFQNKESEINIVLWF